MLWSQWPSLLWCPPRRGCARHHMTPLYVLETVHDLFLGHFACGGILFYPYARLGAGGVPTPSSGLRLRECQCPALPPQLTGPAPPRSGITGISRELPHVWKQSYSKTIPIKFMSAILDLGDSFFFFNRSQEWLGVDHPLPFSGSLRHLPLRSTAKYVRET